MIKRISERDLQYIPNRELLLLNMYFQNKILANMAITSQDLSIDLLMLNMSKAFDTVNREKFIKILRALLKDNELHFLTFLIENVMLRVKIGNEHIPIQ